MSIPAALLEVVARTRRLALGIAPQDALLRDGLVAPIRIDIETAIPHEAAPLVGMSHQQLAGRRPGGLLRHPSGRYSLSYYPGIATEVTLRLTDHERIYVPRRLRVPLVTLAVVQAREAAEAPGYLAGRVRRPVLHPGAAYPITAATGLRGRVLRADRSPVRWAHLELRDRTGPSTTRVLGNAKGDDRGEFLMLLPPRSVLAVDLDPMVNLELSVWGPAVPPVPATPDVPRFDPLWDVPLETIEAAEPADPVSTGTQPPAGYVETTVPSVIPFTLGRVLPARGVGTLTFAPP